MVILEDKSWLQVAFPYGKSRVMMSWCLRPLYMICGIFPVFFFLLIFYVSMISYGDHWSSKEHTYKITGLSAKFAIGSWTYVYRWLCICMVLWSINIIHQCHSCKKCIEHVTPNWVVLQWQSSCHSPSVRWPYISKFERITNCRACYTKLSAATQWAQVQFSNFKFSIFKFQCQIWQWWQCKKGPQIYAKNNVYTSFVDNI